MQELTARAAFMPAPDTVGGLTTSIPRVEMEEALRAADSPPELILDVTRYDNGEPAETRSVSVAWERADLEQLLRQTEGERVLLTFDGRTLADAMAADVDAHGLREKVLVLTVAAATAAGLAGTASARVDAPSDGGATPAVQVGVSPDSRTLAASGGQVGVSPDDRAVTTTAGQVGVSPDDRAVPRTDPQPIVSPDDRAVPRGVTEQPTGVAPDDRAVPRTTTPIETPTLSAPDDGISWDPGPVPIVGIAGAMLLAITGAAFLVAGRRRDTQPA